jgi:hypothetical protein
MTKSTAILPGLLLLACLCPSSVPRAGEEGLQATFGDQGLNGLRFGGHDFLKSGTPELSYAVLETVTKDKDGNRAWQFEKLTAAPTQQAFEKDRHTLRLTYAWGELAVAYTPAPDRLTMDVTLTNKGDRALADFGLNLLRLAYPAKPSGIKDKGGSVAYGFDQLAIVKTSCEKAVVLAAYETVNPPVRLGFPSLEGAQRNETALLLQGGVPAEEYGAYEWHPHGLPRVAPGKALTLRVSLRFGPPGANGDEMAADVWKGFADFWKWSNDWPDRRPIGMLMRSSNYEGHKSATNPRGWFSDPKLDISNKEKFKEAALKDADRGVKVLKDVNGQGCIFWDTEGSENPHPVTYIGDPRLSAKLAPEFDEVADAYFQRFRDANLRTGVCIRPTQVYFDEAKKKYDHGTGSDGGPGRGNDYAKLRPEGLPWWRFYPVVERMCDKIEFCKKRWGCTLFYIDTNGVFRQIGEDQKFEWTLLSAMMLKRIKEKHPDVLLIPELVGGDGTTHTAYWAYAAPYFELDLGGVASPSNVRKLWPKAFSIINVSDGPFMKRRAQILEGVKHGDIILVHGWWSPEVNKMVKGVYDEAAGLPVVAPPAKPKKTEPDDDLKL